ncbi:MAG: GH13 / GH13_2 / GH13_1 / GH13_36 / GH13_ 20 / GH13_19 / GH13_37 / GH13_23 / GH13_16 / GH13 _31 / GH13_40 / GH13_21 / GH13_17 / GH13_29 / GH1 3_4 / GH13_7 / GH13_38 [uncultured Pyrinomonadaceae bacterium]|uniref:GH13 / GH13_2 / GH13_1 / GH13_36 / GH13_ 20 / GH13_19 / GH13_37 / GH13_23 / GH13_16 / GH13 _31 / GH13_40 / GH13_21 / GH13_17 / GH13_29 / GH1 3_4 / GH13_7 / GH13_38 n=1 Tax=uncultured Pyrinomonadaceae bacterium TaxID=2283094 RepID=A0A6J4NKU4_9BACT|nr:MAG: GH13 / GH13_2 / GH13_1 / GH13_36 / GH13_ 20 / GH13_19 / GH13_37 / GH13_23 / GH13_16 / GH13 _31 / GH13_40 / GH13_21 / GH13_17 / GH13_29 / GH1 3_4 / GH13_7 / GH13_38 [uncultured Pyrinomonadaceae bacterium]
MKNRLHYFIFLLLAVQCLLLTANAQTPTVEKIEPPSWWTNSSMKTVRVMIRGTNLTGAKVAASQTGGLQASNLKSSQNGHYLFFDVTIPESTRIGKYNFKIQTGGGSTDAAFEIFEPLPRTGNYQGFLPDDVIYFLMPDRFADGDPSNNDPPKSKGLYDRKMGRSYHGGDLQGVINNLDYIKSLGATAIWTTPVYDNNDVPDTKEVYPGMPYTTGYHGYGATDMYAVDEHLGDMAKLKEFVRKAHQSGLIVMQDQVVNHTGPYHVWANDPPTPTWFNGTVEKHLNNNWQKWTAMNPRATYQTQARNIDGWFIDILPDLNQNDPEVEKYLIQNTLWWIAQVGFDAVRMDTLPHVPRTFWAKWMTALKAEFPKVNVLGELYDSDPALLAYFQGGRVGHDKIDTRIDTLYDFGLFYPLRKAFAQGKPIREVSQMFAKDWLYPNSRVLTTFLGVHDMPRFMNEPGATIEGLKLAQTLIMTSRGTPLLYYGDEIAMPGGADPDNRRDFPGGFTGDSRNAFTAQGRTAQENEVWNHLAKLGTLRKELKPLQKGETFDLLDEEQQMAYARVFADQAVLMIFNNDAKTASVSFDVSMIKPFGANATLTNRLGKVSDVKIENGVVKLSIPARTAGIYTVK